MTYYVANIENFRCGKEGLLHITMTELKTLCGIHPLKTDDYIDVIGKTRHIVFCFSSESIDKEKVYFRPEALNDSGEFLMVIKRT